MSSDNASAPTPEPAPKRDTTILHFDKLLPGAATANPAEQGVTSFTAKAAADTVRESATPVIVPKDAAPLPPESMLGVVSYCYAKGVYGASDIGRKLNEDEKLRAACRNQLPQPDDIRRFRRLNREAIQKTLEKVLRFARKKVAETWSPSNPFRRDSSAPITAVPSPPAAGPPGETQMLARREASERIDKATFIDGMSM